MNQEAFQGLLCRLIPDDFTGFRVVFSGKASKRANGTYTPAEHQILIHNKNFTSDNDMIYTGLHELAHHVQFVESGKTSHNMAFWQIFHNLLQDAISKGIYQDVKTAEIDSLLNEAKQILADIANLEKQLGQVFLHLEKAAKAAGSRLEYYVQNVLGLKRRTALYYQSLVVSEVDEILSPDIRRAIFSQTNKTVETLMKKKAQEGASFYQARMAGQPTELSPANNNSSPEKREERLRKEMSRISKTMTSLKARLKEIEAELEKVAA